MRINHLNALNAPNLNKMVFPRHCGRHARSTIGGGPTQTEPGKLIGETAPKLLVISRSRIPRVIRSCQSMAFSPLGPSASGLYAVPTDELRPDFPRYCCLPGLLLIPSRCSGLSVAGGGPGPDAVYRFFPKADRRPDDEIAVSMMVSFAAAHTEKELSNSCMSPDLPGRCSF